jgi:hypothetical protein
MKKRYFVHFDILFPILLTASGFVLCFYTIQNGHGSYFLTKVFFPFGMMATFFNNGSIGIFSLAAAAVQFHVYVIIVRVLLVYIKSTVYCILITCLFHCIAAFICLLLDFKRF